MQNFSKIIKVLGLVALIIAVGLALGWLVSHGAASRQPQPHTGSTAETPGSNSPSPIQISRPVQTSPTTTSNTLVAHVPDVAPVPLPVNLLTNWEDKLDDILASESDDTNKVKELFEMFPRLPPDGQVEIAQHLSNLVEDEDYAPLGKLLENAKLPEDVLDILMADALNRPNNIKLPVFLELAKNPDHAKAEEAKDLLELYLDEDYGTDWNKWRDKMNEWLKENPE